MIAVGTENAAKLAAVRRTLQEYPALQNLSVAGVKVPLAAENVQIAGCFCQDKA